MNLYLTKWAEISQEYSRLIKEQLSCWTLCHNHSISYTNSYYITKHNFSLKFSFSESGSLNLPSLQMHNSKITGPKINEISSETSSNNTLQLSWTTFFQNHPPSPRNNKHKTKVLNWTVWTQLSMNDDIRLQMSWKFKRVL